MLRKDYIMRLTEEFGKFIGILFGLKQQNKWDEVEKLINESALKFSGTEIEFVEQMESEKLAETLLKKYDLNSENLKMLADLLYEKGLLYVFKVKETEAQNAFIKALLLFRYVKSKSLDSDFSLDMHYKLLRLEQMLEL